MNFCRVIYDSICCLHSTILYDNVFYRHPKKITMYTQCISQLLYVKILQFFFVFIRIIKIIHVGLGCHLGFNFVHQFCLQKVKKKIGLYNRSKSQKSTRTKRVSSSFDRSQWKAKRTTGVCVYITIKTPQGDRCTISCQGASGHS